MKAFCEDVEIDPEEEELSPDSACSAESDQVHSDQAHDRELLAHYILVILTVLILQLEENTSLHLFSWKLFCVI